MVEQKTVQEAVLGEILPNIGKRSAAMAKPVSQRAGRGAQKPGGFAVRGFAYNSVRVPQSVVKRVFAGGCHSAKELRRQMQYVIRDEARVASWSNQIGIERSFGDGGIERVVGEWSGAWTGAPKRGHTDHIILSFPKGTEASVAEDIARAWGQEMFASGAYVDRFRYVAALHHNTEHVHAHFIVDKVGMEEGKFLSISKHSEMNYDVMREMHAEIAAEHGLALNATTRLSRGIIENPPHQADVQAARKEEREPEVAALSIVERMRREAMVRGFAADYRNIARLAAMSEADDASGWLSRILDGAESALANTLKGEAIMSGFERSDQLPPGSIDPVGRLIAAREMLIAESESTWTDIQNMEPGAEKVELEQMFAAQTREMGRLLGHDFLKEHATAVDRDMDPYAVRGVSSIAAVAGDSTHRFQAEADRALHDFRDGLAQAFEPHKEQLAAAGTSVEEMSARFSIAERTEAQLAAWRPDDPSEREAWFGVERLLAEDAERVGGSLAIGRELQEELARRELLDARHSDRLMDIAALDRLVSSVRADLSILDAERVALGEIGPLAEQVRDPGIRAAVRSEISDIAAAEQGNDPVSGRDSASAVDYRDRMLAFERAERAREERGRDTVEREIEL